MGHETAFVLRRSAVILSPTPPRGFSDPSFLFYFFGKESTDLSIQVYELSEVVSLKFESGCNGYVLCLVQQLFGRDLRSNRNRK